MSLARKKPRIFLEAAMALVLLAAAGPAIYHAFASLNGRVVLSIFLLVCAGAIYRQPQPFRQLIFKIWRKYND